MLLGLLSDIPDAPSSVEISPEVHGAIVVAGYSGMAAVAFDRLVSGLPESVGLYQFSYALDEARRIQ